MRKLKMTLIDYHPKEWEEAYNFNVTDELP